MLSRCLFLPVNDTRQAITEKAVFGRLKTNDQSDDGFSIAVLLVLIQLRSLHPSRLIAYFQATENAFSAISLDVHHWPRLHRAFSPRPIQ